MRGRCGRSAKSWRAARRKPAGFDFRPRGERLPGQSHNPPAYAGRLAVVRLWLAVDSPRTPGTLSLPAPPAETFLMPPATDDADLRAAERLTGIYDQMTQQLGRVIVGQADVLKQVMIAL